MPSTNWFDCLPKQVKWILLPQKSTCPFKIPCSKFYVSKLRQATYGTHCGRSCFILNLVSSVSYSQELHRACNFSNVIIDDNVAQKIPNYIVISIYKALRRLDLSPSSSSSEWWSMEFKIPMTVKKVRVMFWMVPLESPLTAEGTKNAMITEGWHMYDWQHRPGGQRPLNR